MTPIDVNITFGVKNNWFLSKSVLVIGAGLGGLATALRLASRGYHVDLVEQYHQAGGRLNQFKDQGFTFDVGPSFFSMSYEFRELFEDCNVANPLQLEELDPIYSVNFAGTGNQYNIHKNLDKLAAQFEEIEPDFKAKAEKYLQQGSQIFHDTQDIVIKNNFNSLLHYLFSLTKVPWKHGPKMFQSMWSELDKYFDSEEVKIIFSLVAFFLGDTPFNTPAVYSLLNYTELQHDGYWNIKGGMYEITKQLINLLEERNVKIHYNTSIQQPIYDGHKLKGFEDSNGHQWQYDLFIVNADAAAFRGKVLGRPKYDPPKLDQMHWTLAPFTIYLGVKGKLDNLDHHNYFLGDEFRAYASQIFSSSTIPQKPYYYVSVSSKSNPEAAPKGCENLFILCPVPDLRTKPNWDDRVAIADNIIEDLSTRINFDLKQNTITKTIWDPIEWESNFNLYRGSGLGLAHSMKQIGGFRPSNKDEVHPNLYYVGASTTPGTGLPMVVISSKLAKERILEDHGIV